MDSLQSEEPGGITGKICESIYGILLISPEYSEDIKGSGHDLKGTHVRDFIVHFSLVFGIIQ